MHSNSDFTCSGAVGYGGVKFRAHAVNVTSFAETLVFEKQAIPHESKTFKLVHSFPVQEG